MKNRFRTHSWLISIIAGALILVFSIPGYFTSAVSTAEQAAPPPIQPREIITTNVIPAPERVTRIESLEIALNQTGGQSAVVAAQVSSAYLNTTTSFIRSTDEALNHPPVPDRIEIPSVALSAPIVIAEHTFTNVEGSTFGQWLAPGYFAAGWHPDSALPGEVGNTVINGHHNVDGEVFADLVDVQEGDTIIVHSGDRAFAYVVTNRMILPETFMDTATRLDNARWLASSEDTRLTLVTCWPKESYTHRLILVAVPVE
jgi:sortase A